MRSFFPRGMLRHLLLKRHSKYVGFLFFHQIALHGLRRLVEDFPVAQRAAQFDVLGVGPHQRTRRT